MNTETKWLLKCLYAVSNPPYIYPIAGGYMDQDPIFLEALDVFSSAPSLFGIQKENNKNKWKDLQNKVAK